MHGFYYNFDAVKCLSDFRALLQVVVTEVFLISQYNPYQSLWVSPTSGATHTAASHFATIINMLAIKTRKL